MATYGKKKQQPVAKKQRWIETEADGYVEKIPAVDVDEVPEISEGIEGPMLGSGGVAGSVGLPGESLSNVKVDYTEGNTLAGQIFVQCDEVLSTAAVYEKLSFFQRMTLYGAYLLAGQLLGRQDGRGLIKLSRSVPPRDAFDAKLWESIVQREANSDAENKVETIAVSGVAPTASNIDLIGISRGRIDDLTSLSRPTGEEWLTWIYEEIRRVRASILWAKLYQHKTQLILQGVQIVAAQLLGISDKHGPVTLKRYIEQGGNDPRVSNALGYWRRK